MQWRDWQAWKRPPLPPLLPLPQPLPLPLLQRLPPFLHCQWTFSLRCARTFRALPLPMAVLQLRGLLPHPLLLPLRPGSLPTPPTLACAAPCGHARGVQWLL